MHSRILNYFYKTVQVSCRLTFVLQIQIQLGIFYIFWEELTRLYAREQILVLQNSQLRDKAATMTKVYKFLDMSTFRNTCLLSDRWAWEENGLPTLIHVFSQKIWSHTFKWIVYCDEFLPVKKTMQPYVSVLLGKCGSNGAMC